MRKRTIVLGLVILLAVIVGVVLFQSFNPDKASAPNGGGTPELSTETVVDGLGKPWDVAFTPDGSMLFTEKAGRVSTFQNSQTQTLLTIEDVVSRGEGGLMGLAVDPEYAENRFIYVCFNSNEDIRVARLQLNNDLSGVEERSDIITGMPNNTTTFPGRHSGCRPRFGPDGYLWVGTGDVAIGTNPQDSESLGGKVLRVDRDGQSAPGNLGPPFDSRVYSYGHRNIQGLAFFTQPRQDGVVGYSIEHGPDKDDEVNELRLGNFGWDPVPGYNESVPMTDTRKFPEAVEAVWNSGGSTIAPSGGTILDGPQWKGWNGAPAMAVLKGQHVRILTFDNQGKLTGEQAILKDFGRIRSAVMGPQNDLYLTTDNGGGQDKIIRVTPK